jgi:hypothetical protein
MGLGVVVHSCNPSYSGGRGSGIAVEATLSKKGIETLCQLTGRVWWCVSVMSAAQEEEVGGQWPMQT